jgi:hypothetical protein
MASMLVDSLSGDYDPAEFEDDYAGGGGRPSSTPRSTGAAVIAEAPAAAADTGEVVDLLEALQRSVDRARAARGEPVAPAVPAASSAAAPAQRAAAAKTTPAKTAATKATAAKTAAAKTAAAKTTAAKTTAAKTAATKKTADAQGRLTGCLKVIPCTGWRGHSTVRSLALCPRLSSPQGRFSRGGGIPHRSRVARGGGVGESTCSSSSRARRYLHVHLRSHWHLRRHGILRVRGGDDVGYAAGSPGGALPPPVGAVRLRIGHRRPMSRTCAARPCARWRPRLIRSTRSSPGSGPDPLRADADPDRAWRRIAKSPRSIADLLMDQAVSSPAWATSIAARSSSGIASTPTGPAARSGRRRGGPCGETCCCSCPSVSNSGRSSR